MGEKINGEESLENLHLSIKKIRLFSFWNV